MFDMHASRGSHALEGDTCCIGLFFTALPMERPSWRRCGGNGYSTDGLVVMSAAGLSFAVCCLAEQLAGRVTAVCNARKKSLFLLQSDDDMFFRTGQQEM